jgi:hypothetical protein
MFSNKISGLSCRSAGMGIRIGAFLPETNEIWFPHDNADYEW